MDETALHPDAVSEILAPEGDQTSSEGAQRMAHPWAEYVDTSWDKFDFTPFEQFIEVDGRKINYVDLGDHDKPVLLYVHGLMGTWRNWIFNLLPFADRYRVIALDLPGFGLSEMPRGEFTIDRYVWTVKQFVGQLGLQKVTLVGNSMGGLIGAVLAKRTPEILDKLVLVDPAGFSTAGKVLARIAPAARVLDVFMRVGVRIRKLIAGSRMLAGAFTKIVLFKPAQVSAELILVLLAGIGKPGFVPSILTITQTPIKEVPGEITSDTVIIWGRNDSLIPKSDAFRYARLIPHAKLELMDQVGHIPMFEAPERFNAVLEQHLAATSRPTAAAAQPLAGS